MEWNNDLCLDVFLRVFTESYQLMVKNYRNFNDAVTKFWTIFPKKTCVEGLTPGIWGCEHVLEIEKRVYWALVVPTFSHLCPYKERAICGQECRHRRKTAWLEEKDESDKIKKKKVRNSKEPPEAGEGATKIFPMVSKENMTL